MAKIHDLFIVELAEVIKGYGNEPDDEDPFRLAEFYRFYELPNIAVSRENFEKMRPAEPQRKTGKWIKKMRVTETEKYTSYDPDWYCACCGAKYDPHIARMVNFCYVCGADMRGEQDEHTD